MESRRNLQDFTDWIILLQLDKGLKEDTVKDILLTLDKLGLLYQVHLISKQDMGLFIHCPDDYQADQIISFPYGRHDPQAYKTLTPAQRLGLIYSLLTRPQYEGGAGMSVKSDSHPYQSHPHVHYVDGLLTLHDEAFCKKWIFKWSHKWILDDEDLTEIRDFLGEKTAFYFAFVQYYVRHLILPSIVGLVCAWSLYNYSWFYGVFIVCWGLFFKASWQRRAHQLALKWETKGWSQLERQRTDYLPSKVQVDPITGQRTLVDQVAKRYLIMATLTLPTIVGMSIVISLVIILCLAMEIYVQQVYTGPFKPWSLCPTLLYALSIPSLTSLYNKAMMYVNYLENRPRQSQHRNAMTRKLFLVSFLLGFLNLFVIGWLFIPFQDILLQSLSTRFGIQVSRVKMTPDSLAIRLIFYLVTGQILNAVQELLFPIGYKKAHDYLGKHKKQDAPESLSQVDAEYLCRVKEEMHRPEFDVSEEYSEMVSQFGYILLFSCAWPLAGMCCLCNNFLELRSDALKITLTTRRPIPARDDDIGPWKSIISLILWLSSLTTSSLIALYSDWDPDRMASVQVMEKLPRILTVLIVAEHAYLFARTMVQSIQQSAPETTFNTTYRKRFEHVREKLIKIGMDPVAGSWGGKIQWRVPPHQEPPIRGDPTQYGLALTKLYQVFQKKV